MTSHKSSSPLPSSTTITQELYVVAPHELARAIQLCEQEQTAATETVQSLSSQLKTQRDTHRKAIEAKDPSKLSPGDRNARELYERQRAMMERRLATALFLQRQLSFFRNDELKPGSYKFLAEAKIREHGMNGEVEEAQKLQSVLTEMADGQVVDNRDNTVDQGGDVEMGS